MQTLLQLVSLNIPAYNLGKLGGNSGNSRKLGGNSGTDGTFLRATKMEIRSAPNRPSCFVDGRPSAESECGARAVPSSAQSPVFPNVCRCACSRVEGYHPRLELDS